MITINRDTGRCYRSRGVGPIFDRANEWEYKITFYDLEQFSFAWVESAQDNIVGIVFGAFVGDEPFSLTQTAFYDILSRRGWDIRHVPECFDSRGI